MTALVVTPVRDLASRPPEAGRIRFGEMPKGAKFPKAIDVFRFTSADRTALEQIAHHYGGEIYEWQGKNVPPGQYELKTDAHEIRIALPPDPLGNSPIYEEWSGGGCLRRCDGELCEVEQEGPDGPEKVDIACPCANEGVLKCKLKTRLTVILPDVRMTGTWRLDTGSVIAAQELPGMVAMIQQLQGRGIQRASLRLEHAQAQNGRKKFIVPRLGVDTTPDQIASGSGGIGVTPVQIDSPAVAALDAVTVVDDVAVGEIVEDDAETLRERIEAARDLMDDTVRADFRGRMKAKGWDETDDIPEAALADVVDAAEGMVTA